MIKGGMPIWLIFIFHLNLSCKARIGGQSFAKLPAKILVPKVDHGKIGVFATRSPDRPNPIGLTQCFVIDWISDTDVEISGLDLVLGTPIVQILLYNFVQHTPRTHCVAPRWVTDTIEKQKQRVNVVLVPLAVILQGGSSLDLRCLQLAIETLEQEPRSRRSRLKHSEGIFAHVLFGTHLVSRRQLGCPFFQYWGPLGGL